MTRAESDLWILVPAAGGSGRYTREGYALPKPLLRIRDRDGVEASMLAHVLASAPEAHRIVIGLPRECCTPQYVPMDMMDVTRVHFVPVDNSESQVDTVRQMLDYVRVPPEARVLTMDCDTVVPARTLEMLAYMAQFMDVAAAVGYCGDYCTDMSKWDPETGIFSEPPAAGIWGVVSARAFASAAALRVALKYRSTFSDTINEMEGRKHVAITSGWQDWGTPARLWSTGARIVT